MLWEGAGGVLPGHAYLLADGSSVRINTGPNSWARKDPDRPLQMWTVGSFHLDDGPLTPAASAFLGDLLTALEDPGAGLPGPSSHWLSQRATLDPATHTIDGSGIARPTVEGGPVLVWDAAQGWVDATQAGGMARAVDEGLVPAAVFETWVDEPSAGPVAVGAAGLLDQLRQTEQAEAIATVPGTPEHQEVIEERAVRRAELRAAGARWLNSSVAPALAQFIRERVQPLRSVNGRVLVELDHGRLAVVSLAYAENDALEGSRPGLQQACTTADIGQLRNDLVAYPDNEAVVASLTRELQEGAVRHFRLQGVLADQEFVGMRVTEFEVTRPAHDEIGVQRTSVEPHRHIDPGLSTREAMRRAVAGWTPTSVSDAITNALRWLPFINPLYDRYPRTARMPYSNNCADCTRAAADLMQGRDARAAFGDNGARVLDDHTVWGTDPGELNEMWRYAGTVGSWHTWHPHHSVFSPDFTVRANEQIRDALAGEPQGTVAMVLVNWADEKGRIDGGHWFNAAVTEDGVEWLDGQSAQHHAWPPPYTSPYYGYSVITRAQDSNTWVDLFASTDSTDSTVIQPGLGGSLETVESGGRRSKDVSLLVDYLHRHGRTGLPLLAFDLDPGQLDDGADPAVAASMSARALGAAMADAVVSMAGGSTDRVRAAARRVSPAAAALVSSDGRITVSTSMRTSGADGRTRAPDLHPAMAAALDGIAVEHRGDGHGRCAEVAVLSDALWRFEEDFGNQERWPGADALRVAAMDHVARSTISVSRLAVDDRRTDDVRFRFEDFPPCATCEHLVGPDSVFRTRVVPSVAAPLDQPVADWVPGERSVHPGSVEDPVLPVETGAGDRVVRTRQAETASPRGPPARTTPAEAYLAMLADENRTVDAITRSLAMKAGARGITPPTAEDVRRAVRHLVADDHLLVDWASVARALGSGHVGSIAELGDRHVRPGAFSRDPEIDAALSRLIDGGDVRDSDVTLVMHEVVESALHASHPTIPHRLLHATANDEFDWESEVSGDDTPRTEQLQRLGDAIVAARIANATGDWPDDEGDGEPERVQRTVWADGAGTASIAVVAVDAPTGQSVQVEVRWIELSPGQRAVLVLSERRGEPFWWDTPEAVGQLLGRVHDALRPDPAAWSDAVVLGTRPGPDADPDMAQIPVRLVEGGAGDVLETARVLPSTEVRSVCAALRLTFDQSTGWSGVPVV